MAKKIEEMTPEQLDAALAKMKDGKGDDDDEQQPAC